MAGHSPEHADAWKAQDRARARQDATLPQDDRHGDSKGRDAEFELFIGAVCAKAKLLPRLDEPDIIAEHEGTDYGFAAKRVKSPSQIERRMLEAATQVQEALPENGIVVIDTCLAFNEKNEPVDKPIGDAEFDRVYERFFRVYFDEVDNASNCLLQKWKRSLGIRVYPDKKARVFGPKTAPN